MRLWISWRREILWCFKMGEKRRRDGKKSRPKKSELDRTEGELLESDSGKMERVPLLEDIGIPFHEVTVNSVKFSLPWNGDIIHWYIGRYVTRESIIRAAAPIFWSKNYWDHGTGKQRNHQQKKERKAKGISAICQTWLRSNAWDGLVEEASRVFRVEDVMNG